MAKRNFQPRGRVVFDLGKAHPWAYFQTGSKIHHIRFLHLGWMEAQPYIETAT